MSNLKCILKTATLSCTLVFFDNKNLFNYNFYYNVLMFVFIFKILYIIVVINSHECIKNKITN